MKRKTQVKGSKNIFNTIIEKNFINLKEVLMKIQETQNTKQKFPTVQDNQNIKHTEQRESTKIFKEKKPK